MIGDGGRGRRRGEEGRGDGGRGRRRGEEGRGDVRRGKTLGRWRGRRVAGRRWLGRRKEADRRCGGWRTGLGGWRMGRGREKSSGRRTWRKNLEIENTLSYTDITNNF